MSAFDAFVFGALGSAMVEIVSILSCFQRGKFPRRYFKIWFWVTRLLLVISAGIIALAHDVPTKILAIHLGIATPLILQAFAKGPLADEAVEPDGVQRV
jgi:hypothetical protein